MDEKRSSPPKEGDSIARGPGVRHLLLMVIWVAGIVFSLAGAYHGFTNRGWLAERFGAWTVPVTLLPLLFALPCVAAACRAYRERRRGRLTRRSLAPFRLFLYLLFAALLFKLFVVPATMHILVIHCFSFSFGLFGVLMLLEKALLRAVPGAFLRIADLVLFNACVLAIGAEVVLRMAAVIDPSPLLAHSHDSAEQQIARHRYPAGTLRFGFPCNSGGHYDAEFQPLDGDDPLIVAIGDSFSAGIVPHHYHFTTVCERELGGWPVYNMGIPSIGPLEYLYLLEMEALDLEPDLVVINLFVGNDIGEWEELLPRGTMAGLTRLFRPENYYLYLVPVRWFKLRAEEARSAQGAAAALQGEHDLDQVLTGEAELEKQFPWLSDPRAEMATLSEVAYAEVSRKRIQTICDPANPGYAGLFEALDKIVWAAGDTPIAFILLPEEYQVEDALWEELTAPLDAAELERRYPQQRIGEWMRRRSIPCLDLLPVMRAVPALDNGRRHLYHLRDTHFNRRGNEVVGREMARFVRSLLATGNRAEGDGQ